MRNTILAGLALALLAGAPAGASEHPAPALLLGDLAGPAALAAAGQYDGIQVWLDGRRDVLHPNDRVRVRVRTDRSAYVAVFHVDTNGDLDILWPRSPSEDGWVDRGRTLVLGTRGGYDYLWTRGGPGIGYVFAVALDEPLELWRLRGWYRPRLAGWDPDRTIWGDPFYAMDEIVRTVVPEWAQGYESVDHYSYHVGRRYTHPRYACYDGYGDWYYGRVSYWSSCDRVRIILVNRPYYYDPYRWRGSRRVYYERYYTPVVRTAASRPLHGYKERTEQDAPPTARAAERRPEPAARPAGASGAVPAGARDARPAAGSAPAARPDRAGEAGERGGREAPAGARARPVDADRGSYSPPPREQSAPAERERPRRESAPVYRESPPQRESAPAREAAPRRESPPQRESAPARQAPQRESAPRAEPRSRPAESAPPPERRSRPDEMAMLVQQQEDRPVQTSRERPTFQRRGSGQEPRAAQPRRDEQPRRESSPPPQRESRPQQDSGGNRSRPAEPATPPPTG